MNNPRKAVTFLLILLLMVSSAPIIASAMPDGDTGGDETRADTYNEPSVDATHSFGDAFELENGDVYYGNVNRVDDRADYFKVDVVHQQVLAIHMYITGHDGIDQWIPPDAIPPTPGRPSGVFGTYLYTGPHNYLVIDGAYNFYFTRHYCLNICAPVPGTNTYFINISLNWLMTPNNFTWDYMLEIDIEHPQVINSGNLVSNTIDIEQRDTHWYKIMANFEDEVNGSFEILNFNTGDPTERDMNIWIFPRDLGGYPFSYPWDWSSAPNEPIEPINVLSTYDGWFYIKVQGMNHTNSLPVSYRLKMFTNPIPEWPETGVQNKYFDRYHHDSDWYKIELKANQPHHSKPGLWNEVVYFNMTERADAEDLPDFDIYLFGLLPDAMWLDLLDSSFRNDHPDFFDINRDPNKNTEHVRAAAFYNGTYYIEVNAWNNTGYYDMRMEWKPPEMSDVDNVPGNAKLARAGVYESRIHQALDHYDWYKVEALEWIRVQFDSFKAMDMFNASLYKYDAAKNKYVFIKGGWNTWFNFTSREDHLTNIVDFNVKLDDYGLGAGTYYICVYAAVAAQMAFDQDSNRAFLYKTDSDAEANYELRLWVDDAPPFSRPPQIKAPIPDLAVDEDTNKVDYLDLYDYFIDTDVGDDVLRFGAKVLTGKVKQLIIDNQAGTLGFEAYPDFHGKVVIKVTATDLKYLQSSLTWNLTFKAVNDPPRPLYDNSQPYIYTLPEDSIRTLDFTNLVIDVDRNDEVNISFIPSDNVHVDYNPETMAAAVVGAEDWFGVEVITFVAKDLDGAITNLPVAFTIENQEDDPRVIKPIGERVILEDTFDTIPLFEHFEDPDGDDLIFTLSSNLNVDYSVDMETGIMTLTPDADWFGFREIWVTAKDPTGRVAQARFFFIVDPDNDHPEINSVSPIEATHSMQEDRSQAFVVLNVTDPEFSILIYQWYMDGRLVGPSNFYNYRPGYNEQGPHELKVVVIDEEGATAEFTWTVNVEDMPRPPEGGIASPANNARFYTNEKVFFVGLFYDLDGDDIDYTWYVDGKQQSTEYTYEKKLSEGKHEVLLVVSSGVFTDNYYVNITVSQAESPGFEAPLMLSGLAVTFVAVAVWRRRQMK